MITRVPGIRVGHWTDLEGATGCTVVLPPEGAVGSGQVRGGAPGTRETDLLRPGMLVEHVSAVLLTGGSAFGLAAADGVMAWLEREGVGFDAIVARVPIVPAAVLFDLGVGDPGVRPGPHAGEAACQNASEGPFREGSVGAGTGATVAKLRGTEHAVKGGIGSTSLEEGTLVVGAVVAVNAVGEVLDEAGGVLAGSRAPAMDEEQAGPPPQLFSGTSTVLGVIATNATLSKDRANLLADAGHEGISEAVSPSHTIWDGDALFTLATGVVDAPYADVERLAQRVVADSIRRAVRVAEGLAGIPAIGEAV